MTNLVHRSDRYIVTGIIDPENNLIFSINASDPTKFDHTGGDVQFVDAFSNPLNPATVTIKVPARTGLTVDNLLTNSASFIYLDTNGDIVQKSTLMGGEFLRDHAGATILVHSTNTVIESSTNFTPVAISNTGMSWPDFSFSIGNLNAEQLGRNKITGASGKLKLNKANGFFFYHSINSRISNKSPNIIFRDETIESDLSVAWTTIDDPEGKFVVRLAGVQAGVYDDGTAVFADAEPQGTYGDEEWVNHRVLYAVDADLLFVQYGTIVYPTAIAARLGVFQDNFETIEVLRGTVPIATLTMRGGATDLSNIEDGQIRQAQSARAHFV